MKKLRLMLIFLLLLGYTVQTTAEELNMVRVQSTFPETMLKLQSLLKEHGHTLSRVQRVDIGLTKSGYQTDKYRVVFYAHPDEIKSLSKKYPQLLPYLPHKIAIFAEEEETLLVAANPTLLFPNPPEELQVILKQWQKDIEKLFSDVRQE